VTVRASLETQSQKVTDAKDAVKANYPNACYQGREVSDPSFRNQLAIAWRIVINAPDCFTSEDVALAQQTLSNLERYGSGQLTAARRNGAVRA